VFSSDGTAIGFDSSGQGPALILVDGALCHRASGPSGPLAAQLARHFTVFTYDRRGRGDSGDTAPYTVDREIEDIEALIKQAGGAAHVYGASSGAALALEAANRGLPITKLALYEAPFVVDDSRPPVPDDYRATLDTLIASGRRGDAVKYFMAKGAGLPPVVVALMPFMPAWSRLTRVAHTILYDALVMDGGQSGNPLPRGRWNAVSAPTLVLGGSKSPTWMRHGVRALAQAVPNARHRTLEGQTHLVKPKALAPVLVEFFGG
jgi:pimeloyl-ACP methyl ester carboxylesterase